MGKAYIDCSEMEGECTVRISGTKEEVSKIAYRHAVEEHGHEDTPKLREDMKALLKDE